MTRRNQRSAEAIEYRRLYKTARWRARRARQLSTEPLCRTCAARGRTTAATVADHVIPHRGDVTLFWEGDLQSLCDSDPYPTVLLFAGIVWLGNARTPELQAQSLNFMGAALLSSMALWGLVVIAILGGLLRHRGGDGGAQAPLRRAVSAGDRDPGAALLSVRPIDRKNSKGPDSDVGAFFV